MEGEGIFTVGLVARCVEDNPGPANGNPRAAFRAWDLTFEGETSVALMILLTRFALAAALLVAGPSSIRVEKVAPLEFQPVVELLTKMTEVRPAKLHGRCVVFTLGQAYRANDHVENIIVVTEDPPRLAVSFLVSGGYGMNFVGEFFEAPFFTRDESEKFHGLLHGPAGNTTARFPRFALDFTRVETPEWYFISMSFGPLRAPQTALP
jgi:hypothetical protein